MHALARTALAAFFIGLCAYEPASLSRAHAESRGEPQPVPTAEIARRLRTAYPGIVTGVEGNTVMFADGSALPLDDGRPEKSFDAWLTDPDIEDMFRQPYPAGALAAPPSTDFDPGRARNAAFLEKVYGNCRSGQVEAHLQPVIWLPKNYGRTILITGRNRVADKLRAVSVELDRLGPELTRYLHPPAGTYVCRKIAGAVTLSAHGYGIAIDIAIKNAHYWQWERRSNGRFRYQNEIPMQVVAIFEKHGFIWGGRWYHHDTMHFEYRPELLPEALTGTGAD